MISIVLYGRNDNYGYNLHKRAALSLNCMAEVLSDPDDEILFVDYNTPDDYPTFPEAIQDTLTERAKARVRVLRVRSHLHRRFQDRTHLAALEPIARNVAVRRSNPANRWILSTNTDMIFVPRSAHSLTELTRDIAEGFYHLPRFEIPESLWETLDRMDPVGVINKVRDWGWSFHLNEVVLGPESVLYDGPGDFQLMLRSDLFDMCGFDERMLIGWHVDSNIAKRLFLRYGRVGTMLQSLMGYHCDHTRQVTPAHRPDKVENDTQTFVTAVTTPRLSEQEDTWGMPEESIEEIDLRRSGAVYVSALHAAIGSEIQDLTVVGYQDHTYDRIDYDPRHVVPFLADVMVNYPSSLRLGWFGCRRDLLERFCTVWNALGGRSAVLVATTCAVLGPDLPDGASWATGDDVSRLAGAIVFDFGLPALEPQGGSAPSQTLRALGAVAAGLRSTAQLERRRLEQEDTTPRRLIAVNAIHNRFEAMVREYISAPLSPLSTRLRQGFLVRRPPGPRQLLAVMQVGPAGLREDRLVRGTKGTSGYIVYGPYLSLEQGGYRLGVEFTSEVPATDRGMLRIDVMDGRHLVAYHVVTLAETERGAAELLFQVSTTSDVADTALEFCVWTDGLQEFTLGQIALSTSPDQVVADESIDWLPLMNMGDAGKRTFLAANGQMTIQALQGRPGPVAYGPYRHLRPGPHVLRFRVRTETAPPLWVTPIGHVSVVIGGSVLCRSTFKGWNLRSGVVSIAFDLPDPAIDGPQSGGVEFPIWTDGRVGFEIVSAVVETRTPADDVQLRAEMRDEKHAATDPEPLLAVMQVGPAGVREDGLVRGMKGTSGYIVYGPYLSLEQGGYRLGVEFTSEAPASDRGMLRIDVMDGRHLVAYHVVTLAEAERGAAELSFRVSTAGDVEESVLEFCVWTDGLQEIALRHITLSTTSDQVVADEPIDWLPLMNMGGVGKRTFLAATGQMTIQAPQGPPGPVANGPYRHLRPGPYVLRLRVCTETAPPLWVTPIGHVSVVVGGSVLCRSTFKGWNLRSGVVSIAFDLPDPAIDGPQSGGVEFPIWTDGRVGFDIVSAVVETRTPADDVRLRAEMRDEKHAATDPEPLLAVMQVGPAGVREDGLVRGMKGTSGYIVYGPYLSLEQGCYRLGVEFTSEAPASDRGMLRIDVMDGRHLVAYHVVTLAEAERGAAELSFQVSTAGDVEESVLEFCVWTDGLQEIALHGISIRHTASEPASDSEALDWLPFMHVGDAGVGHFMSTTGHSTISARRGTTGVIAFGPSVPLRPGAYTLRLRLLASESPVWTRPFGSVEVVRGETSIARLAFGARDISRGGFVLPFDVAAGETEGDLLQFRFSTDGRVDFGLGGVEVGWRKPADSEQARLEGNERRRIPGAPEPIHTLMLPGNAGRRDGTQVSSLPGVAGCLIYGPYVALESGRYQVCFNFMALPPRRKLRDIRVEVANGPTLVAKHAVTASEASSGAVNVMFQVPDTEGEASWEFRVLTNGTEDITVKEIWLEMLPT